MISKQKKVVPKFFNQRFSNLFLYYILSTFSYKSFISRNVFAFRMMKNLLWSNNLYSLLNVIENRNLLFIKLRNNGFMLWKHIEFCFPFSLELYEEFMLDVQSVYHYLTWHMFARTNSSFHCKKFINWEVFFKNIYYYC